MILKFTSWPGLSYRRFSFGLCSVITDRVIFSGEKKIIHSYSRDYFEISQDHDHIGGAAMVKWYSPPTNVTRVRSPDPPSYEGRVCCLFLTRFSGFLPSTKTNTSKFYLDLIFVHLITSSKLFCYTWVNKFTFTFLTWSVNGKTKQHRQNRCSGVFRLFRCSVVPGCSGVFRCSGFPVFLVLVHALLFHKCL